MPLYRGDESGAGVDSESRELDYAPTGEGPPAARPAPEVRLNELLGGEAAATVATAESCTGGGVARRITGVPGSSAYFLGGIVAYANGAKRDLLGVAEEILRGKGAVSEECARAMAEGARRALGAEVAVATTGIAGPGGATARKPVGLVYVALAGGEATLVEEHRFSGDRRAVMEAATERALELLVDGVERALARRVSGRG